MNTGETKVDVLAVRPEEPREIELRKIPKGAVFTLPGSDVRYIRGPYKRAYRAFLVRDPVAITHHYFSADATVIRAALARIGGAA